MIEPKEASVKDLFSTYADLIGSATVSQIESDTSLGGKLTLATSNEISVDYAPFDHINKDARIVIVGLTPGRHQAKTALLEAKKQLDRGASLKFASKAAKETASFSGPMRANLIAMLDYIGMQRHLGIATCANLFTTHADLVHYTSAIRYPVYVKGNNWSGTPSALKVNELSSILATYLGEEMKALPGAFFIPLGDNVDEMVRTVGASIGFDTSKIMTGLPHPSGANAERIAYFLGRKSREMLSAKTNHNSIDAAKAGLLAAMKTLSIAT
jgi:hypothetical protein